MPAAAPLQILIFRHPGDADVTRYENAVVRATTFLTSILYIIGLTLTDIGYAVVDPRIRLS